MLEIEEDTMRDATITPFYFKGYPKKQKWRPTEPQTTTPIMAFLTGLQNGLQK